MPRLKEKNKDLEYILDKVTLKVVDTLLDNPAIPYNKNQMAEASGVSRDALYRRWDSLVSQNIVKESDVGSGEKYWELDESSETVGALSRIIHEN
ncbi:MAG: hypothetical protein ABEJ56_02040 [Candidatus Nanohaloarchaea archaeon]